MSSTWEDVPDESSPFANVPEVDGIVYSSETISPELRITADTFAPPPEPVYRPEPVKPTSRTVAQWHPGDPIDPRQYRRGPKRPNIVQGLLIGCIPLAVFLGLLYFAMHLYGMRF